MFTVHSKTNQLKTWRLIARIIMLLFAAFLSIFALDVFEESRGVIEMLSGLLIHLLPTFIVVSLVLVSRKNDLLPAIGYTALAICYVAWAWGRFPFSVYVMIAGPLLIAGGISFWAWRSSKAIRHPNNQNTRTKR